MGGSPDHTGADHGGPSRFLLVSDAHLHEQRDARDDVLDRIDRYADAYDCDELLVAGDTGGHEDIEAILDADVSCSRVARGNHDPRDRYVTDGGHRYEAEMGWEVDGYRVGMAHDPRDMGLRATAESYRSRQEPYDIVIYGHSHMPYTRLVDDAVVVGAGSLYTNYNMTGEFPERSAHVIEIGEQVVVTHIDFDSGAVVEESIYAQTRDGFQTVAELETVEGDRFLL